MRHFLGNRVQKSIMMVVILLSSTLVSVDANSSSSEVVEFSTNGEILLLDGKSNVIVSLSMDNPFTEDTDESEEIRDVTFLRHRTSNEAVSITHDSSDLYLAWNDGLVEHFMKQGGSSTFIHWVKASERTFSPAAFSIQITEQGLLSWTTSSDNKIRMIAKSDFDLSFPQVQEIEIEGADQGVSDYTQINGQIFALGSSGDSIFETLPTNTPNSLSAISNMWAREDLRSIKAVSTIRNADGDNSVNQLIVVESGGIRLLEMKPSVAERTHILETSQPLQNLPWAGSLVSDGNLQSHSIVKFANNEEQSKRRVFPLHVTFEETPPFTYEMNKEIVQGGEITLSIAGVEKTLSWDEVSNTTVIWEPESLFSQGDKTQSNRMNKVHIPDNIEVKIVDWSPKDANFRGEVRIAGDLANSSSRSATPNGLSFHNDLGGIAMSPFDADKTAIFGNKVLDSSSNAYGVGWIEKLNPKQDLENRFWENQDSTLAQSWYQHDWDLNDISVFNPSSGFTHELVGINGATTKLIDVEPIQSVIEPNRFTQDKNMWWNVEISHSESNLQGGHSVYVPKTVPVTLEVRGVNCQSFGIAPLYKLNEVGPIGSRYVAEIAELTTTGRAISPDYTMESWYECPYDYRHEYTWDASELLVEGAQVFAASEGRSVVKGVKVYTLDFDIPIDSQGGGSAVLPFDKDDIEKHLDMWIRPAEPDDPNYLEDEDGKGMVEWKVIVDPDNTLNEDSSERDDNERDGKEETVFFDDDSYDVMVVRATLKYKACDDWKFFAWNDCKDRNTYTLDAPTVEQAEDAIYWAGLKMQEMYPIPEGRLNMYLYSGHVTYTTTERETINDFIGNLVQRTMSTFNFISAGIEFGEDQPNPPDRVILLTHNDVASSRTEGDYDDRIRKWDRMFGAMAFTGIAPCSSTAIVTKSSHYFTEEGFSELDLSHNEFSRLYHDVDHTADTIIHELGHTMLVGHDNADYFKTTLNDCGLESLYRPGGRAYGWTPHSIEMIDGWDSYHYDGGKDNSILNVNDTERWWDGESYMRYSSDSYSAPVTEEDFEFDQNWIQNVDYDAIQDLYSMDEGQDFLDKWGEIELGSLTWYEWILGIVVGIIVAVVIGVGGIVVEIVDWVIDSLLWIWDGMKSIYRGVAETSADLADWAMGRSNASADNFISFNSYEMRYEGDDSFFTTDVKLRQTGMSLVEEANKGDLNLVLLDSDGNEVENTNLNSLDLGQGAMMHSTLVEKTENMATWKILRNGVTLDSGSLVADNESLSLPMLQSKVVHGEKITIQIEDSTIGSKDMIDCTEDDAYLGPIGADGITYDIYISLNAGKNWALDSKGQSSPCVEISTTKSMITEDFMVKVVANDGMNIRETISNKIEIAGPVHWLSWISSEQAIPGDHVMVEIESRQIPASGCAFFISNSYWKLANQKQIISEEGAANTVFTIQVPENSENGINKILLEVNCDNIVQKIPIMLHVKEGITPEVVMTECMLVEATSDSHVCGEDTQDNGNTMTCDPNGDYPNAPPGEGMGCREYSDCNGNGAYDLGEPCYENQENGKEYCESNGGVWHINHCDYVYTAEYQDGYDELSEIKSYLSSGNLIPDSDGDGIPDRFDLCPNTDDGREINSTGCASVSLYENDDEEDKQTPSSDNKDESMGSQNSIFEGHNLVYLLGTVILGVVIGANLKKKDDEGED